MTERKGLSIVFVEDPYNRRQERDNPGLADKGRELSSLMNKLPLYKGQETAWDFEIREIKGKPELFIRTSFDSLLTRREARGDLMRFAFDGQLADIITFGRGDTGHSLSLPAAKINEEALKLITETDLSPQNNGPA